VLDLFVSVRVANIRGRLYLGRPEERPSLDAMVRKGWVVPVAATPTSLRGYVAAPLDSVAAVIDATEED
jgi:hypothetical protein